MISYHELDWRFVSNEKFMEANCAHLINHTRLYRAFSGLNGPSVMPTQRFDVINQMGFCLCLCYSNNSDITDAHFDPCRA